MKKIFALALVVFGLAACQTEPEGLDVQMGGEQEVMLTVSLPETTRATSANGFDLSSLATTDYSLRYILEVYRVNDDTVLYDTCQRFVETSKNTSMVFPVRLAPGYDYRIVAWTDIVVGDSEEDRYYYTEAGLDEITIIENTEITWNAMDETRDAYTCVKVVEEFSSASDLDMTLTRPFAKVRVVATDITDIRKVGLEPTTATVEYAQDMFFKYNAVAETYAHTDSKSHNISYPATPVYDDATGEYTLFADYIFVPADGTAQFSLDVYADDAKQMLIKGNNFNTEISVQRNMLTTIKGDVLTIGGDVKVTVDNDLGIKEEISYVDTIESLQDKINNAPDGTSTKIVLGGDVAIEAITRAESTHGLVIPTGKNIVLDLNGHTISQTKAQSGKYAMIENNGTLTICNSANTNGVISYGDTAILTADVGYASNTIQNNGTLTINEGVTLLNTSGTSVATYGYPHVIDTNGKLTINGGVLTNEANYSTMRIWTSNTDSEKCVVTIEGGTFNGCIDFQAHNNNNPTIPHYGTLTVNGGTFNPDTFTNSAIRVLRFAVNAEDMHATINDGTFNGKVWVRNFGTFTETPKIFDIYGGTFNTTAKEGTDVNLLANGYAYVEGENGNWTVESKGYYTDANGNYHITGANGWLWMADQNDTYFRNKTIYLDNDIDFSGVDMRVTRMFTPEYSATFDGQGHTVSNIRMASNYSSDNQALFDGLMSVKNLTVTYAQVYGMSQVGIIGANIFGTIENCHVKNSRSYGYVHHVGGIVGLHSWGEIKNCSVENTSIECYYYGAVGAIAGAMNEVSRKIYDCSVKGCSLIKEGPEGVYPDWDPLFGIVVGYAYATGDYVFSCDIENTTIKGVASTQAYGEVPAGSTVNGAAIVNSTASLKAAIEAGKNVILGADIAMTEAIAISNANFTLDGNGYTISQAAECTNTYALFDITGGKATFENVVFDGVEEGAVIRTVGVEFNADNVTAKNGNHTQQQGLFRLMGKSTIKNCTFESNTCNMVITLNYDGGNNDPQVVENCVFKNNTCNATAVLYYVKGAGATINGNKFVGNTVNCSSNGATLYMGFTENNAITNNLFQNNTVNEAETSSRVAGGVFFGYETVFTGNAFIGNNVTGENAKGNDVCVSTYYTSIDLSGNYWGGNAPVEDTNYFVQHKSDERSVIINDYLTVNPFN